MSPRESLSPDEVGALLSGAVRPPGAPLTSPTTPTVYHPRYGSCDRCDSIVPALLTFYGDHDWEPELPADSPVRAVVRSLRDHLGRRAILLCGRCVDTVRSQIPVVPETPGRLFADPE